MMIDILSFVTLPEDDSRLQALLHFQRCAADETDSGRCEKRRYRGTIAKA